MKLGAIRLLLLLWFSCFDVVWRSEAYLHQPSDSSNSRRGSHGFSITAYEYRSQHSRREASSSSRLGGGHWKRYQGKNCRYYSDPLFPLFSELSSDGSIRLVEQQPLQQSNNHNHNDSSSLSKKYKMVSLLYGLLGAIVLVMPDKTHTKRLASKLGGAAGFGVAAGISYILQQRASNSNKRLGLGLGSETYKRLNIGLLGFSILGLFAVPGEAAFLPTAVPAIVLSIVANLVRLYGAYVSYAGWSHGVLFGGGGNNPMMMLSSDTSLPTAMLAPKKALREIVRGIQITLKGMRVAKINKKKSLMYRNAVLMVLCGMFSSFMEGLFHIRYASALNKTIFDSSLQWSAVARLFMMSTLIFSLKDAGDRDRLEGTTFIQLNIMVAAWALLVWIGQGLTLTGFSAHRVEMMAFSLPFLIRGLKFQKLKSDKRSKGAASSLVQPPSLEEEENEAPLDGNI